MEKYSYLYILTNRKNTVLYIGINNDLERRIWEHKNKLVKGFTYKYNVDKLVYFKECGHIDIAAEYEKNMKAWKRNWKLRLINKHNPYWNDLYDDL